jgi:CelD/BcsL family acetyltransferase involved in cellulose biosynthesis
MSPRPPFAAVEIHRDPARAAEAWAALEGDAPATIYQSARFVAPWYATLGRDLGFAPLVVVARDAAGAPAALLALAEKRIGPVRVGFFAGGKDSNANLPLTRPDITAGADDWADVLRRAGRATGLDLFALLNQPRVFGGKANGLTLLPSQDSPGGGHLASLAPDGEAMLTARLSKESRKKYRKKENKLASAAPLRVISSAEPGQSGRILDAFLTQKLARFEEKSIDSTFERPAARAFIEACAASGAITLYGLDRGGRIVATYGGGGHGKRFSAMFNSFDADEEISRSSPGDLLLFALMKQLGAAGYDALDLGIGEARYKTAVCDVAEPLADTFFAIGGKGRLARAGFVAALKAKAAIKRDPRAMALIARLRALLG